MPTLIVTQGPQTGKHFELAARSLSVGRDPSRDIQLTDMKVSRKHAVVRKTDAGYIIASTNALNGLMIGDRPVQTEAVLTDGATISLGDTQLTFVDDADPNHTNAVNEWKNAKRELRDGQTLL